jgi:hypothetical protein
VNDGDRAGDQIDDEFSAEVMSTVFLELVK